MEAQHTRIFVLVILQQTSKRNDIPKIPSPKPLADILERSKREKPSKIPSPRRKAYKSFDQSDISPPGNFQLENDYKDIPTRILSN